MHTTIIITFGLILLALMLFIGEKIGFSRQTLTYSFIVLWLALTLINGAVGMVHRRPVRRARNWWSAARCSACRWRRWCCSWC